MDNWRLVQIYLSPRLPAVYEVELNLDTGDARCSCPTYIARETCRHTKDVKETMDLSGGQYPIFVNAKASEWAEALDDPKSFREYVVKFGKVEVL